MPLFQQLIGGVIIMWLKSQINYENFMHLWDSNQRMPVAEHHRRKSESLKYDKYTVANRRVREVVSSNPRLDRIFHKIFCYLPKPWKDSWGSCKVDNDQWRRYDIDIGRWWLEDMMQ